MIYGIGHDLVENQRIKYLVDSYGQRFINKILSAIEQKILHSHKDQVRYLAKRFAAKEAFAKACGTGLRAPILLPHISIINNPSGRPEFKFTDSITAWLKNKNINHCHLSISDENTLSSAFVIVEH